MLAWCSRRSVNGVFSDRSSEGADRPESVFSSSRRPIVTKDNDFLARALVRGHPHESFKSASETPRLVKSPTFFRPGLMTSSDS